ALLGREVENQNLRFVLLGDRRALELVLGVALQHLHGRAGDLLGGEEVRLSQGGLGRGRDEGECCDEGERFHGEGPSSGCETVHWFNGDRRVHPAAQVISILNVPSLRAPSVLPSLLIRNLVGTWPPPPSTKVRTSPSTLSSVKSPTGRSFPSRRIRPFLASKSKTSGWVLSRAVASLVSHSTPADLQRVSLSGVQTSFLAVRTSDCADAGCGSANAVARPRAAMVSFMGLLSEGWA